MTIGAFLLKSRQSLMAGLHCVSIPRKGIDLREIQNLCFAVDSGMGYGNAILFEPFLRSLRQKLDGVSITLLAPRPYEEIFTSTHLVDHFILFERDKNIFFYIEELQKSRIDTLVETYLPWLTYKERHQLTKIFPRFLYGMPAMFSKSFRGIYETLEHFCLFHDYVKSFEIPKEQTLVPDLHLNDDELKRGRELFDQKTRDYPVTRWVGIHLGCNSTSSLGKRWPVAYYVEIAERLSAHFGVGLALFGFGEGETKLNQLFLKSFGGTAIDCSNLASFRVTAAVIQHCSLFMGNDSALMHCANAVGTPTIGIFGATEEKKNFPISKTQKAILVKSKIQCRPCYFRSPGPRGCSHHNCLNQLYPIDVWKQAEHFFGIHLN